MSILFEYNFAQVLSESEPFLYWDPYAQQS